MSLWFILAKSIEELWGKAFPRPHRELAGKNIKICERE